MIFRTLALASFVAIPAFAQSVADTAEFVADSAAFGGVLAVKEKTAADDLKAFVCRDRFPNGFLSPEGVFNGFQCLLSGFSADLDIGFGNGSDHHAVFAGAGGFGDFLNKGDEILKGTGGESVNAVNLSGVGDKLVHQNQAGSAGVKEIFERNTAGRNALFVGFLYIIVERRVICRNRKLRRHFAP